MGVKNHSNGFLFCAAGILVILVSAFEVALIERKFGIFSAGFLVSRYLNSAGEILWFWAGYTASQLLAAVLTWLFIRNVLRVERPLLKLWNFAFLYGGAMAFALAVKFQLASYFGDAVSFALIKQLGGGSAVDAIKYGFAEGISTAIAFLVVAVVYLGGVWALSKTTKPNVGEAKFLQWGWCATSLSGVMLVLGLVIPRISGDSSLALMRTVGWGSLNTVLSKFTDFDDDNYGLFSSRYDDYPFTASLHPLALDIPGNSIDEDGYGGDLVLVDVPKRLDSFSVKLNPPHVILLVIESGRGDVVGKNVNGRIVAPNLTQLATNGSWTRAYSHVGFTVESLKSLFTGELVSQASSPSLFTELKQVGYSVGVISGQPEDFGGISDAIKMAESADVMIDANTLKDKRAFSFAAKGSLRIDEKYLMDAFDKSYGDTSAWVTPNFLYLNFQSPHFPYHHAGMPSIVIDRPLNRDQIILNNKEGVAATYWNSMAYADYWLGRLVNRLKFLGVWENTILLVSGDHGEDLFEEGFLGHGHIINQRQNQTFLVSNRPGIVPQHPIALSDYREILAQTLSDSGSSLEKHLPFMFIGSIQQPAQIGMLDENGKIVSLNTGSGEACFEDGVRCKAYKTLDAADIDVVNKVVRRWGSERWKAVNSPS
jgi:phosphoglycerol transferase MdoB-like AlkP superfamily enzyme